MKILPRVSLEIGESVIQGYKKDKSYLIKLVDRLPDENPFILNFIEERSHKSIDPRAVIETSLLVYEMIEQAEAGKLNKNSEEGR